MSSTKPTTSARRGLAAAFVAGALALGVLALSARDAQGAAARAFGLAAADEAAALPIGSARDRRLDEAQTWLSEALAIRGADAEVWGALAQTRYFQATGAEVRTVSPALIGASLQAARAAAELAPNDARAQARLALALSIIQGRGQEAAHALMRSYELAPLSEELAPIRVEAAARIMSRLDARTQTEALGEACLARRAGAALGPAFAAIAADPTCSDQRPDSSPPDP